MRQHVLDVGQLEHLEGHLDIELVQNLPHAQRVLNGYQAPPRRRNIGRNFIKNVVRNLAERRIKLMVLSSEMMFSTAAYFDEGRDVINLRSNARAFQKGNRRRRFGAAIAQQWRLGGSLP